MSCQHAIGMDDNADHHAAGLVDAAISGVGIDYGHEIAEFEVGEFVFANSGFVEELDVVVAAVALERTDAGAHDFSGNLVGDRHFDPAFIAFFQFHGLDQVRVQVEYLDRRIIEELQAASKSLDLDFIADCQVI